MLIYPQLSLFYVERYAHRYIGASSELPDPTAEALNSSVERLTLTSAPLQNTIMTLMSIASWDTPMETAAYAALYFTLCVFNYVSRAVVSGELVFLTKRQQELPVATSCPSKERVLQYMAEDLRRLTYQRSS